MQLVKYEAARRALAEAHRVDEAKAIRDKAVAFQAYARQVKDEDLIRWAKEIKIRAERRAGELLKEMAGRGERRRQDHGQSREVSARGDTSPSTLKQLGITRDQSSEWQRLAELPEAEFEARLEHVSRDPATMSTTRVLQPLPKSEWIDPFAPQRDVWAGVLSWLRRPQELPPFDELKSVRPSGGLRSALVKEYRAARAYMADLDRLHEEGFL